MRLIINVVIYPNIRIVLIIIVSKYFDQSLISSVRSSEFDKLFENLFQGERKPEVPGHVTNISNVQSEKNFIKDVSGLIVLLNVLIVKNFFVPHSIVPYGILERCKQYKINCEKADSKICGYPKWQLAGASPVRALSKGKLC